MRSLAAVLAVAAAYALLRGFPESWPEVVRACVAVVALFAGLACRAVARRDGTPVLASRRPVRWLDWVALGAAVLALEVGFVVFFRTTPVPLAGMAATIEEWLRPEASRQRQEKELSEARARAGNWLWNHEGHRPLPRRTNFKPGNRPEVFLRPTGDVGRLLQSRIYVHAFAMGEYRDGVWAPGGEGTRVLRAGDDGWVQLDEAGAGRPVACRVYLGREPHGQNPLVGLHGLVAVRVPMVRQRAPGHYWLPEAAGDGHEYEAVSRPRTLDEVDAAVDAGGGVAGAFLDLPAGPLGSRILHFTEVVSGEGPPVERLRRIRNHLRTTLDYSLVTENVDDRDPLENFLFVEQRGHCEFFATAGALMARAAGVPSRICYGWAGGTYYEGSRLFVFRAREAHAWAEVWLEGEGWVVLDPTPPAGFVHERPELAPPNESPPGLDEVLDPATEPGTTGRLSWLVGLVALAGLPVVLLWPLRRRRTVEAEGFGGAGPAAGTYARDWMAACRRRGVRCFPGRTLRSTVEALGERPGFAAELLDYHYGVRYEGEPRRKEVERELTARIREWEAGGGVQGPPDR